MLFKSDKKEAAEMLNGTFDSYFYFKKGCPSSMISRA